MEKIAFFTQRERFSFLRYSPSSGFKAAGICLFFLILSCASIGRDFPSSRVSEIQIGKTTVSELQTMFGPPWRVGIEDGQRTWTYGRYRYRLFGESNTKDLVVRFNAQNIVVSYSFNTTERDE